MLRYLKLFLHVVAVVLLLPMWSLISWCLSAASTVAFYTGLLLAVLTVGGTLLLVASFIHLALCPATNQLS